MSNTHSSRPMTHSAREPKRAIRGGFAGFHSSRQSIASSSKQPRANADAAANDTGPVSPRHSGGERTMAMSPVIGEANERSACGLRSSSLSDQPRDASKRTQDPYSNLDHTTELLDERMQAQADAANRKRDADDPDVTATGRASKRRRTTTVAGDSQPQGALNTRNGDARKKEFEAISDSWKVPWQEWLAEKVAPRDRNPNTNRMELRSVESWTFALLKALRRLSTMTDVATARTAISEVVAMRKGEGSHKRQVNSTHVEQVIRQLQSSGRENLSRDRSPTFEPSAAAEPSHIANAGSRLISDGPALPPSAAMSHIPAPGQLAKQETAPSRSLPPEHQPMSPEERVRELVRRNNEREDRIAQLRADARKAAFEQTLLEAESEREMSLYGRGVSARIPISGEHVGESDA